MTPGLHSEGFIRQSRSRQKRSSNACTRCRRQKIKCTDTRPCEPCSRRKLTCKNDVSGGNVVVTREYLQRLRDAATQSTMRDTVPPAAFIDQTFELTSEHSEGLVDDINHDPGVPGVGDECEYEALEEPAELDSLTNPLSSEPSVFVTSRGGRQIYLGVSSNWSFTRRILGLVSDHVHQQPLTSEGLIFEGETYPIEDDGSPNDYFERPNGVSIPEKDHAKHLLGVVRFHCGQLYHLYRQDEFLIGLDHFYSQASHTTPRSREEKLWYIHLLVLLAFGKAFASKRRQASHPAGMELFLRAMQLLPNMAVLADGSIRSVEILTCIALYLHSIDHRIAAYNYIGQAKRLAMSFGMHAEVTRSEPSVNEGQRELWRTVLILDREMTAWQGVPQSIIADDMPALLSSPYNAGYGNSLTMRLKLSQVIARINHVIYGPEGRPDSNFLMKTKTALADIANLTDTLYQEFPLAIEKAIVGLSRVSAHMHLLYHQCIILATRPLLFVLLKIRLGHRSFDRDAVLFSPTMQGLTQICLSSCSQIIAILECLQKEDLLGTFLVFDLEALSISCTNVIISPAICPRPIPDQPLLLNRAYSMLKDIASHGNRIAELKLSELQKLEQMLGVVPPAGSSALQQPQSAGHSEDPHPQEEDVVDSEIPGEGVEFGFFSDLMFGGVDFSTDQITELANGIDMDHAEWISQVMVHSYE